MKNIGPIIRAMNHNRTRVVLVVLEIALTLAIVTNCINVILSERAQMRQKSGFDDDNIVRLNIRPFDAQFKDAAFIDNVIDQDVRTIQSVPGVQAVSNTHFQLWEGGGSGTQVFVVGEKQEPVATQVYFATKDIVPALGGTITEGRGFQDGDHGVGHVVDPANKVILTKTVADLLFPDGHAVGKMIQEGEPGRPFEEPKVVIGVLRDFYNPFGMRTDVGSTSDRAIFLPARVGGYNGGMAYLIRCQPGAMKQVITDVEKRLIGQNAGRIFEWTPTSEKKAAWFAGSQIVVTTLTCIIVALIAVTSLGLLGLTSLSVAERRKQIGTRRALGATRADILQHFLVENWIITSAGLVLGIGGAYALNLFLVTHVSDAKLPWQLLAAGVVLIWINGLLSTIPPAMRAMAVSPSIATRSV
jgi:putative ABC transport system permease protein